MNIYFLRHATAGQSLSDPKKDEKRPLDEKGTLECRYIGRALAAFDTQVDAIISSPLKRATQTASLVGNEVSFDGKLVLSDALRPDANFSEFRELIAQYSGHEGIMVVGHNPTLEEFLSRTIFGSSKVPAGGGVELKKGAVAKVEVENRGGRLLWCLTPKIARQLQDISTSSSRPKTSRK